MEQLKKLQFMIIWNWNQTRTNPLRRVLNIIPNFWCNACSLQIPYSITPFQCQTRLCSWLHESSGRIYTVYVKGFWVQSVREPNLKWSRLWKVVNSTRIKTAEEGFNKVHEQGQKFAFLWDVAIIEYKILTDQDCSLTTVKVRIIYLMIGLHRCCWRMLETNCVGDNLELLVTSVTNIDRSRRIKIYDKL